jgi:hypothetical protein
MSIDPLEPHDTSTLYACVLAADVPPSKLRGFQSYDRKLIWGLDYVLIDS